MVGVGACRPFSACASRSVPSVVIPHERLVMVRTGMLWEEKNAEGHPQDVMDYIAIARVLARGKAES